MWLVHATGGSLQCRRYFVGSKGLHQLGSRTIFFIPHLTNCLCIPYPVCDARGVVLLRHFSQRGSGQDITLASALSEPYLSVILSACTFEITCFINLPTQNDGIQSGRRAHCIRVALCIFSLSAVLSPDRNALRLPAHVIVYVRPQNACSGLCAQAWGAIRECARTRTLIACICKIYTEK